MSSSETPRSDSTSLRTLERKLPLDRAWPRFCGVCACACAVRSKMAARQRSANAEDRDDMTFGGWEKLILRLAIIFFVRSKRKCWREGRCKNVSRGRTQTVAVCLSVSQSEICCLLPISRRLREKLDDTRLFLQNLSLSTKSSRCWSLWRDFPSNCRLLAVCVSVVCCLSVAMVSSTAEVSSALRGS